MLHKASAGITAAAAVASAGFAANALQGGNSSRGTEWLWIAAGASLVMALAGGVAWVLTRDEWAKPPARVDVRAADGSFAVGGNIQADRGGHVGDVTTVVGRDHIAEQHVHYTSVPAVAAKDLLTPRMDAWDASFLRREIDEWTDLVTAGTQLADHPGNYAMVWLGDNSDSDRKNSELRREAADAEEAWTQKVRDKLAAEERQYLADWSLAKTIDDQLGVVHEIIRDLRAKLQ